MKGRCALLRRRPRAQVRNTVIASRRVAEALPSQQINEVFSLAPNICYVATMPLETTGMAGGARHALSYVANSLARMFEKVQAHKLAGEGRG